MTKIPPADKIVVSDYLRAWLAACPDWKQERDEEFVAATFGRDDELLARAPAAKPQTFGSRILPRRRRPQSPDRAASRERRRKLGGSGGLPPELRVLFTEGHRSVLAVIGMHFKQSGHPCDLHIDAIAAMAGVGRTSTQTALHEARRLGLVRIVERRRAGRKSLTNLITIRSKEWLAWLGKGRENRGPIGSKLVKKVSTTKTQKEKNNPKEHCEKRAPIVGR